MRNNLNILVFIMLIIGCTYKTERKIVFLDLFERVLFDSIGNPEIHIRQYAEYHHGAKYLIIAQTKTDISAADSTNYLWLTEFYKYKLNDTLLFQLDKLFNNLCEKECFNLIGGFRGQLPLLMISETSDRTNTIWYEKENLTDGLNNVISKINTIRLLPDAKSFQHKICDKLIFIFQKELFNINPPPPPPLKTTLEFEPFIIEE